MKPLRVVEKLAWCCDGNIKGNECGGYGTRMRLVGFGCSPRCEEFSVIRRLALLASYGGQKNGIRQLRKGAVWLVRPKNSSGSGSVLRRHAGVSGVRGSASGLPKLRQSEAGAAGVFGGQFVLYQVLCLLMWGGVAARQPSRT